MYGPKPTRLPVKQSEQSQMYHQNNGNITVWSAQSLASNCNLRNMNRFKQNMKIEVVYAKMTRIVSIGSADNLLMI